MGDKSPKNKDKKQGQRTAAVGKDKRQKDDKQARYDHTPAKSK
jgi:hypothetical protein